MSDGGGGNTKKTPVQWTGVLLSRADDQVRTGDLNLGKVALYQLSYVRAAPWREAYYTQPRSRASRTAACRFSTPSLETAEDR